MSLTREEIIERLEGLQQVMREAASHRGYEPGIRTASDCHAGLVGTLLHDATCEPGAEIVRAPSPQGDTEKPLAALTGSKD